MDKTNLTTQGAPDKAAPEYPANADTTRSSRRKLLGLGTAAVPMVLTLRPGSSFAMSAHCGQRQNPIDAMRSDRAPKLSVTDDEWVRRRVKVVQLERLVNGQTEVLEGEYVRQMDYQGGKYWRVDNDMYEELVTGPFEHVKESRVGVRYAMVNVDPDTGRVMDYAWNPKASRGIHVSSACLASMTMGKRKTGWGKIWG